MQLNFNLCNPNFALGASDVYLIGKVSLGRSEFGRGWGNEKRIQLTLFKEGNFFVVSFLDEPRISAVLGGRGSS
jgi:hypothetical protein